MRRISKFFFSPSPPMPCRLLSRRLKSSNNRTRSKSSSGKKPTHPKKPRSPVPLYQKISNLVEHENPAVVDVTSTEVLLAKDASLNRLASSFDGRLDTCGNAPKSTSTYLYEETVSQSCESEQNRPQNSNLEEDISPIVHKITNIVRSEKSQLRMEERLEGLDLSWSSNVVEMVLKRCFKVGHLAIRFFNWVRLRPYFRHTTETYNVMIYIAGESKDFLLMEKLVDEMDVELCPKNIKTWTIMISHYGKANQIGKALRTFEAMRKSGCEGDLVVYETILCALCNAKESELAMEFYKEMTSMSMAVKNNLYEMLMDCLASSGDVGAVRLVGDDMMKILQVPESDVYTRILRSFCISRQTDEAKQLYEEIKKKNFLLSSDVYETIVKGLCRAGKIDDAIDIVNDVKQKSGVDGKLYGCLINGFLRQHDIANSLKLMQVITKSGCQPTLSTYTEVIQRLFRSGKYEKACELYAEMLINGIEPDIVVITAMVAGHVQHNQISEAWKAFETMKKNGMRPSGKAYLVFIKELCKVCKPQEALKLLEEMSNTKINASNVVFNLVISSLNKVGEFEKARKAKQMHRLYKLNYIEDKPVCQSSDHQSLDYEHKVSSIIPKQEIKSFETTTFNDADLKEVCRILSSYNHWDNILEVLESSAIDFTPQLVEAILRSSKRQIHAALKLFEWINRKPDYTHTTGTYNVAIKIAGGAKNFSYMRFLFQEMKRRNLEITPNTWTIMIVQYGRAGLTEMALNAFAEMKNNGYRPDGNTYKYLVLFLCGKKGQKIDDAIKIFEEMIHAGYMPDREMVEIYLSSLCESKNLVDAERSIKYLFSRGFKLQVGYSLFIKSLCRAGRVEDALKVADEMELLGCTRDQYIYGSIIHALLREGRLEEALDRIEAMKRAGISETTHIQTSLIVHFCKEKKIAKAMEIFKKIKDDGCEPTVVTYSALIRGFMNMGMVTDAWNIFCRMKLKGPIPDFETYSMFITCLCKSGKSEDAIKLLHEMLDVGIIPSVINFRTVFYGLNREGKQDLAQRVLQTKWLLKRERMFSI